jgi:hypothetical protein
MVLIVDHWRAVVTHPLPRERVAHGQVFQAAGSP